MKRRTSCPSTSRKYSAIVTPVRPMRARTPGGSFIWPNTSAVFSRTPDSFISTQRSFPSRERSPTPARRPPGRHRDRVASIDCWGAAAQAVRGVHRQRPHPVVAQVLLDLGDELLAGAHIDLDGVVDVGQRRRRKLYVHDRADYLNDFANGAFRHVMPPELTAD